VKSVAEGSVANFLLATTCILNLFSSIGAGRFEIEVSIISLLLEMSTAFRNVLNLVV